MPKKGKHGKKKGNKNTLLILLVVVLTLILAFLIWVSFVLRDNEVPFLNSPQQTNGPAEDTHENANGTAQVIVDLPEAIPLEQGLEIQDIGSYAGVFMEDGSNETVSGVMMLILKNSAEEDLQLARIRLIYEDFTAEFEATNIPAGERVVLLEKNRAALPDGEYQAVAAENVVFFQEPMSLCRETLEVTGGNGYLDVKNISGEDIAGAVRVFYKNASKDLLYGGITYMATLQDGVEAGDTVRILTGHYTDTGSRIVHVRCGE